jgi:Transcriptional regulator PadR-like family
MAPQLEMLRGHVGPDSVADLASYGGIARLRDGGIEQISRDAILLNQERIYASLLGLRQRGLIHSAWGTSGSNRRPKFYSITSKRSRRWAETAENWEPLSTVIARFFAAPKEHHS